MKLFLVALCLFLFPAVRAHAVDDGFGPGRRIEAQYFNIYYAPGVDVAKLVQQLNVGASDKLLVGKPAGRADSAEAELADVLDTLFLRANDILDMHLYSFKGSVKVCLDFGHLRRVYYNLFARELKPPACSFYVYELNTVYASAEDFKRGVLGHEIGHAVISHYFVVQPSVKVQEVLAGYVEYQLRKSAQ